MKTILFAILVFLANFCSGQSFQGSWQLTSLNGENVVDREVIKIVVDNYFSIGSKRLNDNSFLGGAGGEYKILGDTLIEQRDFDTYDETKINQVRNYKINWIDDQRIEISDHEHTKVWKKLSDHKDQLSRNWVITGRERGGKMMQMKPLARRTIKILNGDRFQWAAFNSDTKTLMASGGGTYSAEDGVYEEHITFFSKDKNRVGDSLIFEYAVIGGKWQHKGKSSKGQPIFEIWSPYSEAYPTEFLKNY